MNKPTICRKEEIINDLLKSDPTYQALTRRRAETSQAVLDALTAQGKADLFEAYSDAIYAEEVYEQDALYNQSYLDAEEALK